MMTMAPASFFYYSPDPNPETRHHGHFIQQHPQHPQQMPVYPVVPTLPSTPIYSRPNSSSSQPAPIQHQQHRHFAGMPSHMTPMASPQPMAHKPTIVLDTDLSETEGIYYPSTPPLSTSGSVISSPGSCDMLATPLNPMFSGLDGLEGVKAECDESRIEKFPVLDWSSCASPPLTPGTFVDFFYYYDDPLSFFLHYVAPEAQFGGLPSSRRVDTHLISLCSALPQRNPLRGRLGSGH